MNIDNKCIMVVGGAGLVGSYIVEQLIDEPVKEIIVFDNYVRGTEANLSKALIDPRVKIIKASMSDQNAVNQAMKGVDGVFLLASLWLGECLHNPRHAWESNVLGSWNIIEACLENDVKRVVYSSSASVYGNALSTPMTEEHPFNNRTTYGATKIAIEQMFRAIYEQHQLPFVGYRYMNIYGPRMDYKGTYVSVIMKVLDRIFEGKPPIIFGDGSQIYDFIYVEDIARANILGMKSDVTDEFFNIGFGEGTTINELVNMLIEITGSKVVPEFKPQEMSFVTYRIGSTEKAQDLLGFQAKTELIDGLKKVVEWRQSILEN
jgi:UDP-glucose 4-epimerase